MDSYRATVDAIYELQEFSIKLGLENITALMDNLGHPQRGYPVIHVAGTNGKGSTCFFISAILQTMGLRVGLFTSPHLVDFRERISINGELLEKEYMVEFWRDHKTLIHELKATFFDTTTALAFKYFRDRRVDVAVIETGLGGRLDSTNIVHPGYVVLTPVHFDHEKQLGETLAQIAGEKAGIIKRGAAIFCAAQEPEALRVIRERLDPSNRFFYLNDHVQYRIHSSTLKETDFDMHDIINRKDYHHLVTHQIGDFQVQNLALAYFVSRVYLKEARLTFPDETLREVFAGQVWAGRLHRVQDKPDVFLDVSHNRHGIETTVAFVRRHVPREKLTVLIGMVKDKNYKAVARNLLEEAGRIVVTEPPTERRMDGELLSLTFKKVGGDVHLIKDFAAAFEFSKQSLSEDDTLLVIGSHYLIGSIMRILS